MAESVSSASCVECGEPVAVPPGTIVGEILGCPGCRAELELVALAPLALALAPDVEEDWGE
ncbi:MAG: lysine biosynthesis protein LysW [Candidatus Dormibacteria bacterium]